MRNDEVRQFRFLEQPPVHIGGPGKAGSHDRRGGDTALLELNTVVETPRRAGTSISSAVIDGGAVGKRLEQLSRRGLARFRLYCPHKTYVAKLTREPCLKLIQNRVGIVVVIVEHADHELGPVTRRFRLFDDR